MLDARSGRSVSADLSTKSNATPFGVRWAEGYFPMQALPRSNVLDWKKLCALRNCCGGEGRLTIAGRQHGIGMQDEGFSIIVAPF